MPNFKTINSISEITLNNKWVPATKFNSKNRLVDAKGNAVGFDYKGSQYRIIEKRERTFSGLERLGRGLLGTIAVICTLCLGVFSKPVRNLFTKPKTNIRFRIRHQTPTQTLSKPKEDIYIDIEKEAPRFFFKEEEQHVVENIEKLIDENVHEYMTSNAVICNHIGHIKEKGFKHLSYVILEHPELDNWIMKGGGPRKGSWVANKAGSSGPNNYDNIMRVFMAERMSKVIEEEQLDIVIPEKRLLPSKKKAIKGLHEKYYIFSKKLEILNEAETKEVLHQLPEDQQRKVARNICQLIKKTGFMDAHFGNIRWHSSLKKVAIIDTESQGLLIEKSDSSPRNINTIKKCALIGLQEFKNWTGREFPIFAEEVDKAMLEV